VASADSRIDEMVGCLSHRGPDGSGTAHFPNAALGHTRLAIIDIAGGRQPMSDHGGRYTITYNGEIYNYRALRSELLGEGYPFSTQSDTEVILALFATRGPAGFSCLRGMYAFAIWDEETGRGVLVRDPLGIKPLFYRHECDNGLRFGSEAKAIIAADGSPATLDDQALHLLMNFRYLPGERTLFQGIYQLAPGAVMTWHAGDIQTRQLTPDLDHRPSSDLESLQDSAP
jgi:asparagine synthase (glutamine-hydrolysing)